ncbi:hypothetical protein C489_11308 [Natrinema versiforme JCM 10478]|uniref:Uncharacterized protein n=1 Tax=Natrinema versiforme JCM 10478 TaxID=1227496 RepID=L9Y0V0_9EURY|nr:hypothetical protein C489_11308 [Natrinema versiforme JCM 10478]
MTAADHDIGPLLERVKEFGELLRWVLEIGVDDGAELVGRFREAAQHCRSESAFLGSPDHPNSVVVRVCFTCDPPCFVRRIIVDDDNLDCVLR